MISPSEPKTNRFPRAGVVLLILGVALFIFFALGARGRRQTRDWKEVAVINTRDAYEAFLKEHPSSPQAEVARQRLDSIENSIWMEAAFSADTNLTRNYILTYPNGKFVPAAYQLLESTRPVPIAKKELGVWWQVVQRSLIVIVQGGRDPFELAVKRGGQVLRRPPRGKSSGVAEIPLTGLEAGSYQIEVRDYLGATKTDVFVLDRSFAPPKPAVDSTLAATPGSDEDEEEASASSARRAAFAGCDQRNRKRRDACTDRKIRDFIQDRLRYPPEARDARIEGTVRVEFLVGKDGFVSNVRSLNDIGGNCASEARRVVSILPRFDPGQDDKGQPVSVRYTTEVVFKRRRF